MINLVLWSVGTIEMIFIFGTMLVLFGISALLKHRKTLGKVISEFLKELKRRPEENIKKENQ